MDRIVSRGRDPGAAVRRGSFDRTLEAFNVEMGQRVASVMDEYDRRFISPIRDWVRSPWYRRLFTTPQFAQPAPMPPQSATRTDADVPFIPTAPEPPAA